MLFFLAAEHESRLADPNPNAGQDFEFLFLCCFFFFYHATGKEGVRSATRVMCLTARRDTNRLILSRNLHMSHGTVVRCRSQLLPRRIACSRLQYAQTECRSSADTLLFFEGTNAGHTNGASLPEYRPKKITQMVGAYVCTKRIEGKGIQRTNQSTKSVQGAYATQQ